MAKEWKFEEIDFSDKEYFPMDESTKIKGYPIKHLKNFILPEQIELLSKRFKMLKKLAFTKGLPDPSFARYTSKNDPIMSEFHHLITPQVSLESNLDLRPTNAFSHMYMKGKGNFPPHYDTGPTRRVMTLLTPVNQNKIWPFYVEDNTFSLNIGDAILFSGANHVHWRNQLTEDNFSHHIIFNFNMIE